jgi:hypothetical protein
MDGSLNVVCSNATTLWHLDAAEWAPSTASRAGGLVVLLILTTFWAVSVWNDTSGVEMGKHGWIALGLGTFFFAPDRVRPHGVDVF